MTSIHARRRRLVHTPLICCICGDVARGNNFDVLSCMSCKAFFRRYALQPRNIFQCAKNGNCIITQETRTGCIACRLKKCFAFGMKPQLIRSFNQHQVVSNNTQQLIINQLPTPRPLDLLRNDRSTLTSEQWNLLSNIIHIYDNQNLIERIKCLFAEASSLPVKLRSKISLVMNYRTYCTSSIQTLLKQSPLFNNQSIDMRKVSIKNNFYFTSCLNALSVARELNIASNSDLKTSTETFIGNNIFSNYIILSKRLDSNSILLKIMLFIIIFSSNCSIVTRNQITSTENIRSSIDLIKIQDMFVNLLWRYLIYQYGFNEAVLRYSSIIKSVLDLFPVIETIVDMGIYDQMVDRVIEQTNHLLITDD